MKTQSRTTQPKTDHAATVAKLRQTLLEIPAPTTPAELLQIPIDAIDTRAQIREVFDPEALESLAQDIAARGIRMPLIVRPQDDGRYLLVAGERRLRAARLALLDSVPALVETMTDRQHFLEQLAENIQRETLTPQEEGAALLKLKQDEGIGLDQLAEIIHKSKAWVSKRMAIGKGLNFHASNLLQQGITEDLELLKTVSDLEAITHGVNTAWALCEQIRQGKAGRKEAREALKKAKEPPTPKPAKSKAPTHEESPLYQDFKHWLKHAHAYHPSAVQAAWKIRAALKEDYCTGTDAWLHDYEKAKSEATALMEQINELERQHQAARDRMTAKLRQVAEDLTSHYTADEIKAAHKAAIEEAKQ